MEVIRVEQVCYTYTTKYQKIDAVKQISCSFETENLYAITGESGSGKSTFLSLLAGLALPTSGTIYVEGKDMRTIDLDEYRKDQASVVYQSFHLFPLLTALENVMFPIELKGVKKAEAREQAKVLLRKVGLPDKIWSQFPQMMSGGEQQRVAIARAMAAGGKILMADEPTGNLDSKNEENIVELLQNLAHIEKYVVIVITHNPVVAAKADVVLKLKDGELQRGEEND